MPDDFSESLRKTVEDCAARIAEQNDAWCKARAALAEIDREAMVIADSDLLDEIEQAITAPSHIRYVNAIRA